jgi:gamma-glutamyltranspeptidase
LADVRSYRPLIMGRRGAVAANHPLATQAGLMTLRAGGNAVDATVAVALTLSVVEPHMSGLGGDAFYHVWDRASDSAVVFNGTGPAPRAATAERYAGGIPVAGPLSVSVPGAVGALGAMHAQFGRLPWAALFDAAIHYAAEGFGATHAHRHYTGQQAELLAQDAHARTTLLHDGLVPALGAPVRQPTLARTLQELAAEGADSFYRGPLAQRLAQDLQTMGALITVDDLAAFQPERQAPIEINYRGHVVRQAPPNSTGWVLLQELKLAEQFDLAALEPGSAELVHLQVEIKKLVFADRERYGADPRFAETPLTDLLSDAYAGECAERVNRKRATPRAQGVHADGDTTYFAVVDGDGNAVSAIQSLNSGFGAGVVAGSTGIVLNNRMAYWHLEPNHPNRLVPGKRVRHTMNPPMVFKDNQLWGVFGTPGGDYQVQVNFQLANAMIDFGYDPQAAVEAPRWVSVEQGQVANYPHSGETGLSLEARFGEAVLRDLAARGHKVIALGDLDAPCIAEAIRLEPTTGMLIAGSDPRRDGWALAY